MGIFHGEVDQLTPASEVKALEGRIIRSEGSSISSAAPSAGYRALFDWVREQAIQR